MVLPSPSAVAPVCKLSLFTVVGMFWASASCAQGIKGIPKAMQNTSHQLRPVRTLRPSICTSLCREREDRKACRIHDKIYELFGKALASKEMPMPDAWMLVDDLSPHDPSPHLIWRAAVDADQLMGAAGNGLPGLAAYPGSIWARALTDPISTAWTNEQELPIDETAFTTIVLWGSDTYAGAKL